MKSISTMSDEEVLKTIENIGEKQFFHLKRLEITKFNHLFQVMIELMNELKARPGDRRIILKRHYGHPNLQVRLNAATHTLALAPDEARMQLQSIAETKRFPQAADAGMRLSHFDDGSFKPT